MADKWAVANGNWATGATWNGDTVPQAGDAVYANGKTVTIDAGLTTAAVALVTTAANAGLGVAGGGWFNLANGSTLVADQIVAGTSNCVGLAAAGITASVVAGSIIGSAVAGVAGVNVDQAGALSVTTSTVTGGGNNSVNACGVYVSTGSVTITADCVGSATSSQAAGVYVVGGTAVTIIGTAKGGAGGAPGVYNYSALTVDVAVAQANNYPNDGIAVGAVGTNQQNNSGGIRVDAMVFGAGGWPPVVGRTYIRDAAANYVQMRQANNGTVTVIGEVANDYPAQADVRSGVSYDFGGRVGTCAVPPAGSVALGVPVDATVGTAALTPEALLGSALKTRLENCATVQSTGDQIAALM